MSVRYDIKRTFMKYRFTTSIVHEKRGYVAHCIELGVVSQGKTLESAQKNLKEAVELFLEDHPKQKQYILQKAPFITVLELER